MAHYFIYPTKDTFISNEYQYLDRNFGIDEVLEIEKIYTTRAIQHYSHSYIYSGSNNEYSSSYHIVETVDYENTATITRALLHFDLSDISQSIVNGEIVSASTATYYLNLKNVEAKEVPYEYKILCYPLSQSWEVGIGNKYINETAGASWLYRTEDTSSQWVPGASKSNPLGGGTWISSSFASQSFRNQKSDIKMNVTDIVNAWLRGDNPNEGFILMHSGSNDNIDYGTLRFYSRDTNTIYSPSLEICWDDSTYSTGSLEALDLTSWGLSGVLVNVNNLYPEYLQTDVIRINVFAREKYPVKSFDRSFNPILVKKYLPRTVYYSIKDAETDEVIVDFDNNTKVSLDSNGHYFILRMSGFCQERYYKIRIKVDNNGESKIYESPIGFKIRR